MARAELAAQDLATAFLGHVPQVPGEPGTIALDHFVHGEVVDLGLGKGGLQHPFHAGAAQVGVGADEGNAPVRVSHYHLVNSEDIGMNTQRTREFRYVFVAVLMFACAASYARHHHAKPATGQPGQFDYYVLTLSWSPTYCLTHPKDHNQCSGKGYGFVLHGLWPQFDAGTWPEFCSTEPLPPAAEQLGSTLFPSRNLMEHEWQRHGTCSGLDAVSYFRTADEALASVHVPADFEAPGHGLSLTGPRSPPLSAGPIPPSLQMG